MQASPGAKKKTKADQPPRLSALGTTRAFEQGSCRGCLEGAAPMLERPPRFFGRRGGFVSGFHQAGDHIEAHALEGLTTFAVRSEPRERTTAQAGLLARIDRFRCMDMSAQPTRDPTGLDLDEDERARFADHQINLDARDPDVARDDLITSRLQEIGRASFPLAAERLPPKRHPPVPFFCVPRRPRRRTTTAPLDENPVHRP